MKLEWLTERCEDLSAREIRYREMAELDLSDENKRRVLECSEQFKKWEMTKWIPFVSHLLPGDEVWRFRSPPQTWSNFCGCAGYAVLRDGQVIRTLTTMRS